MWTRAVQVADIFISLHVIAAARVTGGPECPVRSGPQGGSSLWGCFLPWQPQNRKKEGKLTRQQRVKGREEGLVLNMLDILDCRVFSQLVPTPRHRPLLLPQLFYQQHLLLRPHCPLLPPPTQRDFPENKTINKRQNQGEKGEMETDLISSVAVRAGVI